MPKGREHDWKDKINYFLLPGIPSIINHLLTAKDSTDTIRNNTGWVFNKFLLAIYVKKSINFQCRSIAF